MEEKFSYYIIKDMCNSIILECKKTKFCAIIDPSSDESIIKKIKELSLIPKMILLTHGHYDHILFAEKFRDLYNIPIYCSIEEKEYLLEPEKNYSNKIGIKISFIPDKVFDSHYIKLGELDIKIILTPGHTKGGVSFYIEDSTHSVLFSGDTLFKGTIGRTDLYGGNFNTILNSIEKNLLILPKKTIVVPGHGHITSIESEYNLVEKMKRYHIN